MEAFTVLLEKAMIKGAFRSMKDGVSIKMEHFIFADDLLVFSKGDPQSLAAILQVFQEAVRSSIWPLYQPRKKE